VLSREKIENSANMSWIYLIVAIALEVAGTVCMKLSEGCTQLWPAALMLVFYALGLGAMSLAVQSIDVSIGYALWTGVGLAIVALIGIVWFEEPVSMLKLASLLLIIVGVAGLNYSEKKQAKLPTVKSSRP
jgi:small multidrug resistance pump